jgi:hypothetical protein
MHSQISRRLIGYRLTETLLAFALNRATSVYLCVFAVFVIGIWMILELGSALLTAPRDLSGNWRLLTAGSTQTPAQFNISQSGRYVRIAVDRGPQFDVVLARHTDPEGTTFNFQGDGWTVTGSGSSVGDSLKFTFQPPNSVQPPPTGTYQRQRMGQEIASAVQSSTPPSAAGPLPASPPNALH